MDEDEAKDQIRQVSAKVLSNRKPPYSLKGGVYETLKTTDGAMYSVTNREVTAALELFEKLEGIDICPAAGVAVSSLLEAVKRGAVGKRDCIVVNVIGGGEGRVKKDHTVITSSLSSASTTTRTLPSGRAWAGPAPMCGAGG